MGNMTFSEAAYAVLKRMQKPLSADETTSIAIKQLWISPSGKTPSATMGARLYVDTKTKRDRSRFERVDKGKFGLREWSRSTATASPILQLSSFKDAAYKILKSESRPLRADVITDVALRRGLLRTIGKTPEKTMGAQLYTDIKTNKDKSAFIQPGKSRFGLREWGLEVIEEEIDKASAEGVLLPSDRTRSIVGDPINFGGLIYGPLNEHGVIFLFSKTHDDLGTNIEAIQPSFPDAKGRRKGRRGWEDIWIEFEFRSSNFKTHKHDVDDCDIIVCWEHDWQDCPIEVIELSKELDRLR